MKAENNIEYTNEKATKLSDDQSIHSEGISPQSNPKNHSKWCAKISQEGR